MKKILVTGGNGFIGSYTVEALLKKGFEVYSLSRNITQNIIDGCIYHECDILNMPRLMNVFNEIKPDCVIHLAGILGTSETWSYVSRTCDVNIQGSVNVYECCAKTKSNICTVDVGSRWLAPYTITKRVGSELAIAYGIKYNLKIAILRIFNVYGPRQSHKIIKIIPNFIKMALLDSTLEIWGNKMTDLVYGQDVGEAFALSVENIDKVDKVENIFIGSGIKTSVESVARMVINEVGKGSIDIQKSRLGEENIDAGYMSNNKAKELLNWEPKVSLLKGLKRTVEWYKEKDITRKIF